MTLTATATRTNTYTEARLRAVMPEIGADFYSLAAAGFITYDTAVRWTEDVRYLLSLQVVRSFEIQLTPIVGYVKAVRYGVSSDGSIRGNDTAGGIDWYGLPSGTKAMLFVDIDWNHTNGAAAEAYTSSWSRTNAVAGDVISDRAYAKDGYGVQRGRVGSS